jgi:hypothetical protein
MFSAWAHDLNPVHLFKMSIKVRNCHLTSLFQKVSKLSLRQLILRNFTIKFVQNNIPFTGSNGRTVRDIGLDCLNAEIVGLNPA